MGYFSSLPFGIFMDCSIGTEEVATWTLEGRYIMVISDVSNDWDWWSIVGGAFMS